MRLPRTRVLPRSVRAEAGSQPLCSEQRPPSHPLPTGLVSQAEGGLWFLLPRPGPAQGAPPSTC